MFADVTTSMRSLYFQKYISLPDVKIHQENACDFSASKDQVYHRYMKIC